jgi:hypothetical protein
VTEAGRGTGTGWGEEWGWGKGRNSGERRGLGGREGIEVAGESTETGVEAAAGRETSAVGEASRERAGDRAVRRGSHREEDTAVAVADHRDSRREQWGWDIDRRAQAMIGTEELAVPVPAAAVDRTEGQAVVAADWEEKWFGFAEEGGKKRRMVAGGERELPEGAERREEGVAAGVVEALVVWWLLVGWLPSVALWLPRGQAAPVGEGSELEAQSSPSLRQ